MAQAADLSPIFSFSGSDTSADSPINQPSNSLILNNQINVVSLVHSERIIVQVHLTSSEIYFFGLLYEAFPFYVLDHDIHLSPAFIRKRVVPDLRKKMLVFAPHLYLLRVKEIGYVLLSSTAS